VRVLVTGGAGYIGSVVTEKLVEQGHKVVALDNLTHGHPAAVHPAAKLVRVDLLDGDGLKRILATHPCDAVVHLAAEALIDESLRDPGRFFRANVSGGLNLLEAMVATGVTRLIFSSTAAVYGEPEAVPIVEQAPRRPVNSYGESKLMFERMLSWYRRAHGLRHISFRYFNAAGATARCGEFHVPETHLIPILFEAAVGQREAVSLFGTDYDTPDGTCIRDYVHVSDIAQAHVLALAKIDGVEAGAYNIGTGAGYSNRAVIQAVRDVTGCDVRVLADNRRPGDPARLVASSDKLRRELGWEPRWSELDTIVDSAWQWRRRHPCGYAA